MRFLSNNYTTNPATVISCSSENIYFKSSNLNSTIRSKHYRSSGFFYFDGKTVDSITLDGAYTPKELVAALNMHPDMVWSYDSNRFRVETTILISGSALSDLGFNGNIAIGTSTGKICLHTEEFVTFDIKTTEEVDSIVILWPKEFILSSEAVVKVQASATSNFNGTLILNETLSVNELNKMASLYLENPVAARYFRIVLVDKENAHGYVSLGTVILSNAEKGLDFPDNTWGFNQVSKSSVTTNDFGVTYIDKYPTLTELSLDYSYCDSETARRFIELYQRIANNHPVFMTMDYKSECYDKDLFSIYGLMPPSLGSSHVAYKLFNQSITITEIN